MPLGKRADYGDARYAGAEVDATSNIVDSLQQTLESGFDFLATPLVHPTVRRTSTKRLPKDTVQPPFTHSDLLLTSSQWASQIVGKISPWIYPDSEDLDLRIDSESALRQELEWAAHLSLQACILPLPASSRNSNYARIILQVMHGLSSMALWVRIPLVSVHEGTSDADTADAGNATLKSQETAADSWQWWNQIRGLCGHHAKLGLLLDVPERLPSEDLVERWLGEPVRAISIQAAIFQTNRRGYPTLSKAHQDLLLLFFRRGVQVILSGQPQHALPLPTSGNEGNAVLRVADGGATLASPGSSSLRIYHEYLSYLFRKPEASSPRQQLEMGYQDYLQAPLQPLQDNLESQTYETFERDMTKYQAYEDAVYAALVERVPQGSSRTTVVMVVGAGRGPLVRSSLRAAERAGRKIRIFAVEKNPNAVVTLQNLVISEGWGSTVTIVAADMRYWEAPEKADILVSELLGSFGDNELSPECLDGAQRFLHEDGISIPATYTSYLQPVSTSKLWNDVRAYEDLKHFETPYVVKLHRFTPLSDIQEVFTFHHPNFSEQIDNSRSCTLLFARHGKSAAVCHGFAGYFDAQLYGQVHLSTHPHTHTTDMFSWFPIFFPLKEPVYCPPGKSIEMSMWRCTAYHKVWYEWAITEPTVTQIHNPTGRSYYVGL